VRAGGILLALVGLLLALRSVLLLAGRGRPRRGPRPALVLAGPYLWMRNPLLAGALLMMGGVTLVTGSWWLVAVTVAVAVGAHLWVLRCEEPRLLARFGKAWAAYIEHVPRWLPRVGGARAEDETGAAPDQAGLRSTETE
jgi:protein-S-isoprenylcysteine O-methyltransferase Ste14